MNDVAHSHTLGVVLELVDLISRFRGQEIDVTDDAPDGLVLRRELQKPTRLVQRHPGLNCHGRVEPDFFLGGGEILGRKVSLQDFHAFLHPGVFSGVVVPEVLMGIDLHE